MAVENMLNSYQFMKSLTALEVLSLELFHFFTLLVGAIRRQLFLGKENNRAWSLFPQVTETFSKLSNVSEITENDLKIVEIFFVILFSPTINCDKVNIARRILFTQGKRALENIPPTSNCLKMHILRSCLQSFSWVNCLSKERRILDPLEWG